MISSWWLLSYLISSQEIGYHKQVGKPHQVDSLPLGHPGAFLASSQSFFSSRLLLLQRSTTLSFFSCSGLNRLAPFIMCPDRQLRTRVDSSSWHPKSSFFMRAAMGCCSWGPSTSEDSSFPNCDFWSQIKNLKKRICENYTGTADECGKLIGTGGNCTLGTDGRC